MLTPNKTLAEWVKFGNSLRLRLAMRVANVDKALATEQAQKSFTLGQFLEAPNEIISVSTAGGYNNPLGEINKSWGEVFMGATMDCTDRDMMIHACPNIMIQQMVQLSHGKRTM